MCPTYTDRPLTICLRQTLQKECKHDLSCAAEVDQNRVLDHNDNISITGGESLIMPAGMIHMVRTCADSVAVGFNFITMCELGNYEIQF